VEEEEGERHCLSRLLSVSSCRAFEAEEDEDVFDRVAADSLHGLGIEKCPLLDAEVRHQPSSHSGSCGTHNRLGITFLVNSDVRVAYLL
jgi:hypothetical protein